MVLTQDFEDLIHLIARAFARAHGQIETAETYASTVLTHAKAIVEEDAAPVVSVVDKVETKVETVATEVKADAESVLQKVEDFVSHLIHPETAAPAADASPASTEPPAV